MILFQSLKTMPEGHPGRQAAEAFEGQPAFCECCGYGGTVGHEVMAGATPQGTHVRFSCTDPGCIRFVRKVSVA